jgi:ribosomal peptide maturation radical SAM protein 1
VSPALSSGGRIPSGRRWHLVCMPWQSLGMPSLAMALVAGILESAAPGIEVTEHFLNIEWAEFLERRSGGQITPGHVQAIADNGIEFGLGDWVFSGALYGDPGFHKKEMLQFAADRGATVGKAAGMRALAGEFTEMVAAHLVAAGPAIVGFTSTFMQNVPSLAVAARVKSLAPGTVIVFGGANCDGPMGAALHRNHPFIDYVVRGEAEMVLPELACRLLEGSADMTGLDGVCWWRGGESVANLQIKPLVPAERFAAPDYGAWYERLDSSPISSQVTPFLVVEGSRGCWWGAKHHCTFCGLNDATIAHRSKPADRVLQEIMRLAAEYRVLDFITADNIMAPEYYGTLLNELAAADFDLRIHFELKANVTEEQIAALAAAGLVMVQFGIESFSTRVLRLMRKGLTGAAAVRVLRDALDHGVTVGWNYLYGFPGEHDEDYLHVIGQMPALTHLQPCLHGEAVRIELTRFSPLFEDPGLGFRDRSPAGFYRHAYDLPERELQDLAYYWDTPDAGITGDTEERLNKAIAGWTRDFPVSSLHMAADNGSAVFLADRRAGWQHRDIELTGWQRAAYLALRRPRSRASLQKALAAAGEAAAGEDLGPWLTCMVEQGLVFRDDTRPARHVALATRRVNAKLAR